MSWKANYFTAIVFAGEIRIKYHRVKHSNQECFQGYLQAKFRAGYLAVNYYELKDGSFAKQVKLRPG